MTSSTISTLLLLAFILFQGSKAAIFTIRNNCPYPVWAAALPGGGQQLNRGQTWNLPVAPGTRGRIWPRTGCLFNQFVRRCWTGDCNGIVQCRSNGAPPYTLAQYTLNQLGNVDSFNISLVNGFNVPMEFSPTSNGCTRGTRCTASSIITQCPVPLRAFGGCNNPCTVFRANQYCCNSRSCGATDGSNFFETKCPDALSNPSDQTSTFTCPSGTNYRVVFCP